MRDSEVSEAEVKAGAGGSSPHACERPGREPGQVAGGRSPERPAGTAPSALPTEQALSHHLGGLRNGARPLGGQGAVK